MDTAANALQCIQSGQVDAVLHKRGRDDVLGVVAVRHMASSLAVEWAKKGVRVNTLR